MLTGDAPVLVVDVTPVDEKFMFVWIGLNEVFDIDVIGFKRVGDGLRHLAFETFITEFSFDILFGVEDANKL